MTNPKRKNEIRKGLSFAAKKNFLARFAAECARGVRGGITEEELRDALSSAIKEQIVQEVQES
ncbi:MAG: hypothetical protein BWY99_00345 [Synergistetes bacterium ADurb.BinA166]|nr:MAG: hypothetical protein BWY99_00345 [Synergistetes bacterium ADurb.BinA166]